MATFKLKTTWSGAVVGGGLTVSYFFVTSATPTSAQAAIDLMRDFWTSLNPIMSNAVSWAVSGIAQVIDVNTGLITSEIAGTTRSGTGTETGDRLPAATQGLLRLDTPSFINGRRLRGHWNIPGPTETRNTNAGLPDSTYITTLQNAANTLNAAVDPTLDIYSRTHHVADGVSAATAVSKWAVLRSRRD